MGTKYSNPFMAKCLFCGHFVLGRNFDEAVKKINRHKNHSHPDRGRVEYSMLEKQEYETLKAILEKHSILYPVIQKINEIALSL